MSKPKSKLAPKPLPPSAIARVVDHLRRVADEIESGEAVLDTISAYEDICRSTLTLEMKTKPRKPIRVTR